MGKGEGKSTTEQVEFNNNPEGKGGFGDNPQNRNPGGRPKNAESYKYWLGYFIGLTVSEFKGYPAAHPDMTMAAAGAYRRVEATISQIRMGRDGAVIDATLDEFKEVADRVDGKAQQAVDVTSKGDSITAVKIEIVNTYKGDDSESEGDERPDKES